MPLTRTKIICMCRHPCAQPAARPGQQEPDIEHISHQRIVVVKGEEGRIHSFDGVGWSPDVTKSTNEKILGGFELDTPKVHSTKFARRMTFVGGSKGNGDDMPTFGIFPCDYEQKWAEGAPRCRQLDPE